MYALACSGGKDSLACFHLMRTKLDCAIYVDTGYAYEETQTMIDYIERFLPVHRVYADRAGQNAQCGIPADIVPIDWTVLGQAISGAKAFSIQSFLQCCWDNISAPLFSAAHRLGVTHLVMGQRLDEERKGTSRHGDILHGMTRLYPIEHWTTAQVLSYLRARMTVPTHFAFEHTSLDCYDCPAYRRNSGDRIAWMQQVHPSLYIAYRQRRDLVQAALQQELSLCQ